MRDKKPDSFWKSFLDGDNPEPDITPPSAVDYNSDTIFWAMNNLPASEAVKHLLICGTVGSGKTKSIQLFLQSITPRFSSTRSKPEQLIVFDAKGDMVQRLAKLGLNPTDENVYILNPFDSRGASWNLGEAITTPSMARYLASLLIPEESSTTAPYFPNTAREIVFWVALSLSYRRQKRGWTLRDLLNALDSTENVVAVTNKLPRAKRIIAQHVRDERHFPGVMSTLSTKIGKFEEVAALWATSKSNRGFSVKEFLSKPGVLILGHDPVQKESMAPMNAVILQALTNEILRQDDTNGPRHWFVLDEFRAMGNVQCVRELLNLGRSKGASVLLGIQSVEGLMEIYGHYATDDILGLCSTKTFLRSGSAFTAEWAEKHFAKVRRIERTFTETHGSDYSHAIQYQLQERFLFLSAMFLDLPFPARGGTFSAISDVPCLRCALITDRPFDDVLALCHEPSDKEKARESAFRREGFQEQIIKPWEEGEQNDFCDLVPAEPEEKKQIAQTHSTALISAEDRKKRRSSKPNES